MEITKPKLVIVTGPESVGKSTVAVKLTQEYDGEYIPEFSRSYIEKLNRPYTYDDINHIATHQQKTLEEKLQNSNKPVIFTDTHLIITKVWFLWHSNSYPPWIDAAIARTKNALYLLCAPDIEWLADSVRENGGKERIQLHKEYKGLLDASKLNYREVDGQGISRTNKAIKFVSEYLNNK